METKNVAPELPVVKEIMDPIRTSPSIAKLAEALSKAQGVIKSPKKDKTAVVKMKSGGEYRYNYSDLADLLEAIRQPFAANGLVMVQVPFKTPDYNIGIATRIMHSSGEWIEGTLVMPVTDASPQALGSVITYGRRYSAGPMAGVASEDDDDGNAATGNNAKTKAKDRPAPPVARNEPPPAPPEPEPKKKAATLFDSTNRVHLDLIKAKLTDKVPDTLWDEIAARLQGKPIDQLRAITDAVVAESQGGAAHA